VTADEAQRTTLEKVRILQGKLYRAAKAQPQRTFGVLFEKVCSLEVLWVAWAQVRRNRGAAGVDAGAISAWDRAAYAMVENADAKRALDQIHRELERINPSAARSLEEGMEETLTVHKLRVPELLRKSLNSTNIIESAFSVAEELCRRVKRWREGDHRERWAGSALLAEIPPSQRLSGDL
jgi:hypothetical protein